MENLTIDDLKQDHRVLYELALKHRHNKIGDFDTSRDIIYSFFWSAEGCEGHEFWSNVYKGNFTEAYLLRPDLKTPSSTSTPLTRNGISVGDWYVVTEPGIDIYINNRSEPCKKGKVINIIDIEDIKYHLSTNEFIPNLDCVLHKVFKCADRCAAEIYAYELLNPTIVSSIDPISSVSDSVSVVPVVPTKPMSKLQPYIAECKERFKIGDTVRNNYGSVFTLENLDFFETSRGIEYNNGRDGYYNTCVHHNEKGFAQVISKVKIQLEEALAECKRRFSPGDKIKSLGGSVFILNDNKMEVLRNYISVGHQNSFTRGGTFAPNLANLLEDGTIVFSELLEKACDVKPTSLDVSLKKRKLDALNHIRSTFTEGMTIRTDLGDELDLVGDFEFILDEDCIYIEDEDGECFCVYDLEDDVYPTIIESAIPAHVLDDELGYSFKLYPETKSTQPIDPLESCLDLLKVKTLAIN